MLKQIATTIAGAVGLSGALAVGLEIRLGDASVTAPPGWREVKKEPELVTLRSTNSQQQATVTLMLFGADASFDDFKKLCAHRTEAEKKELGDGFVQSEVPFEAAGTFGMYFSGADKKTSRVFSGYLTLKKRELVTVYVEGIGITPKEHLESFKEFVRGLHWK